MAVQYLPKHSTVLPRWIVYNPVNAHDIIELIDAAGSFREYYTFVITGVPSEASPRTYGPGTNRPWISGQSLTQSYAKSRIEVEDELLSMMEELGYYLDNYDDVRQFLDSLGDSISPELAVSYITAADGVEWYSIENISIIDR